MDEHISQQYRAIYPRLSSYYFFYFAVLGAVLPYLSLYLQSLEFSPVEIGQLFAILIGTKVIAPNLIGWLADKQASPIRWVRLTGLVALITGTGLLVFQSFWALFWTLLLFSFFWHAALPQYEAYAFSQLGRERKHCYGMVRLWGSLGFIAAVLILGWLTEAFGITIFPFTLLGLLAFVWFSAFLVKDKKQNSAANSHDLRFLQIVKQPWIIGLLLVSFIMQFSHGAYYSFYSIYLTDEGYSTNRVAWLWALGVIAEIAIFFWMAPLMKKHTAKFLIILSLWLTVLRWLLIAFFVDSIPILIFAQILHAASFGLFHAAAIHLIDESFQGNTQGQGQAIFAASSHGLGGAVGMLFAGYAWAEGGALMAYGISALAVVFAVLIAHKSLRST